ncbi:hypothetical protein ACQ4M4_18870 [Leptolyngbya sp. AN02str]|uniref:hypothetical protein n=1 Tax=Leptolyngbya sp. AN02str TaxID=3423363 RepID=UPI003D3134B2
MLSQIVRPMVRTQLRLLANSQATRATLVNTIAQWLGFLGVEARVTHLDAASNQIQVSLTVGKPEACDPHDWQQILKNLHQGKAEVPPVGAGMELSAQQRSKLVRLLAYVIQVGNPHEPISWDALHPQLMLLGFDDDTLMGIRSALKIPQDLDMLMEGLEPDLAAIALPKAVSIALLDRQVNPSEDKALAILLDSMKLS